MTGERSDSDRQDVEVVVIGAGLSGVAALVALRRAGFEDIVALEKSGRLGGTWRDNTYPGCGCDVPSMLYEYSFAPHAWSRCFAGRSEILDYLESTAATHGVDRAIRYDTEVLSSRWDPDAHRWELRTTSGTYTARAVIVATGPWHRPRHPDIPGLDTFPGTVFHSARWDHEADLTGRRVAVVGTGASTVQFLPEIQPKAAHVDVFQSTPQWVLPKPDYPLPPGLRRFLGHHPAARRALRGLHHWTQEAIGVPLRHPRLLGPLEALARLHLRTSVPDRALRRALTPTHRLGGRRLITSGTYYPALTRPNVRLHPTRVTAVEGSDVIGADGTRTRADIIVLATGYHIGEIPLADRLHGVGGTTLARTWADSRRAYLGTSVSGYPNLFLLIGPNLLTGTTAVPTVLEAQLRYVTTALTHLRTSGCAALDVRPEAEEAHQQALHEALRTTVYNTAGGTGYYFGRPGVNTFCWPWSTARLVKRLHAFTPDAYTWTLPLPAQAGRATHASSVRS
ncbi:flavin-containing monooxygenase [Streptomyces diastatochromogenes]|uniref:Cyclohexanone monooxygenase n=1 Tax=Streptomyces diastatochromogenes TaxID=42236 RepID=A0A233S192_STRDA|nr:NAD(P)/FAD-dependent oxidoreductase [Streptomyces diastatochromogenes]MCZ0984925.1 NAD(P)/FAD-dependent oxidoreductase [Streptomyces diastatochromogenes]OXY89417.1 cyclohexanone monooxygenase [Streptomyces diastatochromogenes]